MQSINQRAVILFFVTCVFAFAKAYSQTDSTKTTTVVPKRTYTTNAYTGEAPTIDGIINEDAWNAVEWAGDFVENEPDENTAPAQQTKFKITYDQKYLYVAWRAYDTEPDKIERRMGRRDDFPGDWVEINIDSYNDDRSGFSFTISASGVKGDEFISNNGNFDDSWNPIWYAASHIDEEGWTAEAKIPLSQLKFGKAEEQVWGLQINRLYFRNQERDVWQRVPQDANGWVSNFGELRGLKNIEPQKQLEIQPFLVSQYDTFEAQAGNPFRDGDDFRLNGGIDAKIGITNDLTLDLTVNPDFGQVDADPGAIALDGFEIFFQERRPFFVENANIFRLGLNGSQDNLFFSRRIGRSPQGFSTADGSKGEFEDFPINSTILGAAKFSGKTKDGWSIGALQSITANEFAEIELDDREEVRDLLEQEGNLGENRKELVEPLTSYSVVRLQKDLNNRNSFVGGLVTYTDRTLDQNLSFLHDKALTGGIDGQHTWQNRNYFIDGKFLFSNVRGSAESITRTQQSIRHLFNRVDADHVEVDPTRTSLTGTGGRIAIGKDGGGNWRYGNSFAWRSPELELNDIGFLRQADEIRQSAWLRYLFLKPTSWYRRAQVNFNQFTTFDFDGNYNRIQYDVQGNINWKNNWFTEVGFGHKPRIFINTFLRGGPRWRFSDENFSFLFAGTDQRKKFSAVLGHVYSQARENNFQFKRYVVRFNWQPLDALSLNLETEYEKNPNKTQYVSQQAYAPAQFGARYITGEIDQETLSTTLRVNYNINPNLTIQYYAQPFIAKGTYTNFNYVANSEAERLSDRVTLFTDNQIDFQNGAYVVDEDEDGTADYSFGDPDFNFVQFRSNLVMRWEYIPGSELFLVWSQGIEGNSASDASLFEAADQQILGQQIRNTFLVKWTYRFVL
ncbi:hypothetical protein GCM10011344_43480 [Dokdonia pacifica]|uniref:Carbohydrate family 9 binding domain-like n=1 Tax=Dokdonia pacifica TaxID=1627892 RepID=A0A239AGD0_9FLAO|nr:DUF5916 domain-containing protein [Dokdonia pacifica]GGG37941.1 hypothetical protein GCM10011344_43480 [Dokdonia pacifica]SNR93983.1 Carbohydrate family 9 binding domain-like [Dokdonia pacifica]